MNTPLLEVSDLAVSFPTRRGLLKAVRGVRFEIYPGELFALVGESGCGKSVTAAALMGLLPPAAEHSGRLFFKGRDLSLLSSDEARKIRGHEMAMVFQDPFESLNPVMNMGNQIREALEVHGLASGAAARRRAQALLEEVRIPDPERFLGTYPHEASGGMRQRVMIAMALSCRPDLIIADEPTTALDVTTQAGILQLFTAIKEKKGTAILLITHDLALVSQVADRVGVMYAGRIVETASRKDFFENPQHPYSRALLDCVPTIDCLRAELNPIPGEVSNPLELPSGCPFHPRCSLKTDRCMSEDPVLVHRRGASPHETACWEVGEEGGLVS